MIGEIPCRRFIICAIAILFFISSCGNEKTDPCSGVKYDSSKVVWIGTPSQNAYFDKIWKEVEICLGETSEEPTITLVDGPIIGNDTKDAGLCVYGCGVFLDKSFVITSTGSVAAHEFIHWISGRGNDAHYESWFVTCEKSYNFDPLTY